ncbi:MspA family porin [Mycolicibacterium vaccae]|uniref:MspA family porin n=1 Tax=Mycolicibacterium vaccae TaxID=1810 RepID=UPI003CE87D05
MPLTTRVLSVVTVAGLLVGAAPVASAQPDVGVPPDIGVQPVAGVVSPPDGAVLSGAPGVVVTPDGWELTVAGRDESQVAVAPLTTAMSSREYLVAGTFTGSVKGSGSSELSGGKLEVGYQIGCGISLNVVKLNGSVGLAPSLNVLAVLDGARFSGSAQIEVFPQPGEVVTVQVTQKSFSGTDPRVTVKDARIKIDGCIGQSFLRSYAILTSSTDTADDIVAYYGVAKAV